MTERIIPNLETLLELHRRKLLEKYSPIHNRETPDNRLERLSNIFNSYKKRYSEYRPLRVRHVMIEQCKRCNDKDEIQVSMEL